MKRKFWTRPERWMLGLCGGFWVAMAWLFGLCAWGLAVQTRGASLGAFVFCGIWSACTYWGLDRRRVRSVVRAYLLLSGAGWLSAALGGVVLVTPTMRWHPVLLAVDATMLAVGLGCIGATRWTRGDAA